MNRYKVYVCIEAEYDDIEALNEEDAFIEASNFAMNGGDWQWDAELLEENIDESKG